MTELERILVLTEIGQAAIGADRLREQTAAAREKRQGFTSCEHEQHWSGPPCWKHYDVQYSYNGDGEPDSWQELLDKDEWCGNCLARQEAHEQYVVLRNKLGGMRAGLARRCTHYRKRG